MFNLAAAFGTSPREVMAWPAAMFRRAAMWLSGKNQGEADRAKNAETEAKANRHN